jgi:hypothetical protein
MQTRAVTGLLPMIQGICMDPPAALMILLLQLVLLMDPEFSLFQRVLGSNKQWSEESDII